MPGRGEFAVIADERPAPAVVPATMPVRGAAGKGGALASARRMAAVGAAVVVCLVYVGLPLLVSTESVVRPPLDAMVVAGGARTAGRWGGPQGVDSNGLPRQPGPWSACQRGAIAPASLGPKGAPRARPKVPSGGPGRVGGRTAGQLPAPVDSGTLYLRDVPDEVVKRLERLSVRDGVPVEVVAVRELAEASRRADNPLLLGSLPDLGVSAAAIVADLGAGRAGK